MMKQTVFVIMPFSATLTSTAAEWAEIYENVFIPGIEDAGYMPERAEISTGSLAASIIEKLHMASITLADLTDRNPNVFYELGIRHSLSKRTILLSRKESDVPSDLRGYWFMMYGTRPAEVTAFRKGLCKLIRKIEAEPEKSDNPVADYLSRTNRDISAFVTRDNIKKINALCTELTGNLAAINGAEPNLISAGCLDLLLTTMYIDMGPELLKDAYNLKRAMAFPVSGLKEQMESFLNAILGIRQAIGAGSFQEPQDVSFMRWRYAGEVDAFSMSCEEGANYISQMKR